MKNLSVIAAVLHKDFRIFWPTAALTALLVLLQITLFTPARGATGFSALIVLMQVAALLANVFFIISLIHEDAIVSSQHDWLIRPIPGHCVLAAKLIFIASVVIVPSLVGQLFNGLTDGYSIIEASLAGAGEQAEALFPVMIVVVLSAITANQRQAALLFVAFAVAIAFGFNSTGRIINAAQDLGAGGLQWMIKFGIEISGLTLACVVLWLQYVHRRTALSLKLTIALLIIIGGVMLLPWSGFFAVQKALSQETETAATLKFDLADGCFVTRSVGVGAPASTPQDVQLLPTTWKAEQLTDAGPKAIAFATALAPVDLPGDARIIVSHVAATYLDGDNSLFKLRPVQPYPDIRRINADALQFHRHYWLLPRAKFEHLAAAPRAQLRLDYSLTLLGVERSIEIAADGNRARYEDLGYCGATFDSATQQVSVDCFVPGDQPALLLAQIVGDSEKTARRSRASNFSPDTMEVLSSERHLIRLPASGTEIPRVRITTYEAREHFDRQLFVPGVLGGSPGSCPAPG